MAAQDDARERTSNGWNVMAARLGSLFPAAEGAPDVVRRVRHAVRQVPATTAGVDVELAVLIAASNGALKEKLRQTRRNTSRQRSTLRPGSGERFFDPLAIILFVIAVLIAALGPVLSFTSVRTINEFLVDDLGLAALSSGIVMLLPAIWFAVTEHVDSRFGGSLLGMYGAFVLGLLAAWSLFGVGSILVRLLEREGSGAVFLGLLLQIIAVVLYLTSAVTAHGDQHRAEALRSSDEADAQAIRRSRADAAAHRRIRHVISRADGSELDRAAVAAGLQDLVRREMLSLRRAEDILRLIA